MERILLSKQSFSPNHNMYLHSEHEIDRVDYYLNMFNGKPVAVDFETTGLSAITDEIVSVGLSNGTTSVAIKLTTPQGRVKICNWLTNQQIIAFNYMFDGAFIAKYANQVVAPYCDAMIMFKTLSNEGMLGQRWSLKVAMTEILGWPNVNNSKVDEYMRTYKVAMHNVPFDILGEYNALDALATYQLWQYLTEVGNQFPGCTSYWQEEWKSLLSLLIEQHVGGISIDVDYFKTYHADRTAEMEAAYKEFIEGVAEHVNEYNRLAHAAIYPPYPSDKVFNKDGSVSKRYKKYQYEEERDRYKMYFNVDSSQDLCWLFYDALKFEVAKTTPTGKPSVDKSVLHFFGVHGRRLQAYRKIRDEVKFIKMVLNDHVKGVIHPAIKPHGTITGRCSSGSESKDEPATNATT